MFSLLQSAALSYFEYWEVFIGFPRDVFVRLTILLENRVRLKILRYEHLISC